MGNIIKWIMASNRWLHLLGGFAVGLLSNTFYCSVLAGVGVAGALEFKDYQWGGRPDVIDFLITIVGVAMGFALRAVV